MASAFLARPQRPRLASLGLWGLSAGITGFYLVALARSVADAHSAAPLRRLPDGDTSFSDATQSPRVSVIVPARDEERNIVRCVESLLAQDYPNVEIIVVDDGSTDATPELLARLGQTPAGQKRLRVVRVDELPSGWAGKPHALHTGAQAATGAWLLFTDADTWHAQGALRSAMARAERDGADLFTIGTAQELPDFWNRVMMPIAYMGISFMYPPALVNNAHSQVAIANGQFLLIRRSTYERLGGYDTPELRGTVVDDLALARVVKRSGGRLVFTDGRGLVKTRMYQSLAEHWNGWGKNAVAGSRGGVAAFALLASGLPLITVGQFALLAAGVLRRDQRMTLAGAIPVVATLAYRAYLDRMLAIPLRYGWTHPLGGVVFTGILSRAFWRKLRGRTVPWRGRSYVA
ncbi:MAG TPA: glycosyltransferase [Ktedonobacterales bacterium]|nr:glycosyltransferase [Ktedonobacterales bacterium]